MDESFQGVVIDALTEAIIRKSPVTIKSNVNNCIIVITATGNEIIVSVSKVPYLVNDIISTISDSLGERPDMVFNRVSVVKEGFIIYYMVWLQNIEKAKSFVEKEFAIPQNNITFMSSRAVSFISDTN